MTQTTQQRLQTLEEQIRSHRQDLARSRQSFQEHTSSTPASSPG